jgi:hypothetical protein
MLLIGPETNWSHTSMNDELAATELLARTEATTDLISFTEYTWPRYETARIHRIIAAELERVERGEIDRLMLLVPPRHGPCVLRIPPEIASRRLIRMGEFSNFDLKKPTRRGRGEDRRLPTPSVPFLLLGGLHRCKIQAVWMRQLCFSSGKGSLPSAGGSDSACAALRSAVFSSFFRCFSSILARNALARSARSLP